MTISTQDSKVNYQGNGQTTVFQIPFPFLENNQIYVQKKDAEGTLINYTYATDYTVTGAGEENGGSVTINVAPEQGSTISIYRDVPLTQEVDYRENEIFPAETHEEALDKLTMEVQQIQEQLDRSVKVDRFSDVDLDIFINEIERVYESTDNVDIVANNINNVNAVGDNIANVNTTATNIEAIQYAPTAATNAANSATASANSAKAAQDAADKVQGLIATPIGTIFQSVYVDESLDIARQLNGQLISSTKFTGFRSWLNTVQTATPSLFTTETNWQAEKTNSKLGQCGKFVVDDTAGTIRLPCVVNAQGLVDLSLIGGIKSESLPNITGISNIAGVMGAGISGSGVFSKTYRWTSNFNMTSGTESGVPIFDASDSSSTYQDNAPVQQEAVQYPYYIQVATGVEETLPAIREYNINTPFFFGQSMYSDIAPDNASWLASNGQYNARSVYPDYYDWLLTQYNNPTESNVVKVGSVTDNNGVLGGFSASSVAIIPSFRPRSYIWEQHWKVTTGSDVTSVQYWSGEDRTHDYSKPAIGIEDGHFLCFLSSTGTDWNIGFGVNCGTAVANTTYYVKFGWNGSEYYVELSTDGVTYNRTMTINNTAPIVDNNYDSYIGCSWTSSLYFRGSVDINESYININGQRWWNGRKAIVIKTGEASVSPDYDFVVNQNDQTFKLPLLNGDRVLVAKKEATTEDPTWYNLYSDGWLEQGGVLETSQATTVTFVKPYITTPNVMATAKSLSTASVAASVMTTAITLASFSVTSGGWNNDGIFTSAGGSVPKVWSAQGYTNIPQNPTWNLYYYVGDTVQDASLINAGAVLGQLANVNAASRGYVVESYHNGTEWYRIYSDGWIEQGGLTASIVGGASTSVTYVKTFSNTQYTLCLTSVGKYTPSGEANDSVTSRTTTGFSVTSGYVSPAQKSWYACGY